VFSVNGLGFGHGGKGDCVKAGWGEEGERVQDHALGVRRRHAAPLFSLGFSLECLLKDGFTDATLLHCLV